jgi:hypothetical protein
MRVNPDSGELFRLSICVDLPVKEVGYRLVVEGYVGPGTDLFD